MDPLESMVKECDEEASLPEDFVRARLRYAAATFRGIVCSRQECGLIDIFLHYRRRVLAAWCVCEARLGLSVDKQRWNTSTTCRFHHKGLQSTSNRAHTTTRSSHLPYAMNAHDNHS